MSKLTPKLEELHITNVLSRSPLDFHGLSTTLKRLNVLKTDISNASFARLFHLNPSDDDAYVPKLTSLKISPSYDAALADGPVVLARMLEKNHLPLQELFIDRTAYLAEYISEMSNMRYDDDGNRMEAYYERVKNPSRSSSYFHMVKQPYLTVLHLYGLCLDNDCASHNDFHSRASHF